MYMYFDYSFPALVNSSVPKIDSVSDSMSQESSSKFVLSSSACTSSTSGC